MKGAESSPQLNLRRWLPGVLISLVAIYVLFRLANGEDLSLSFSKIQPGTIIAVIGLTLAFLVARAVAWSFLLDGKASIHQTFLALNQGYLINNVIGLRLGEVARALFLGQSAKLNPFHVLSSVVIERAFDMAIAAGLMLSTLPLALGMQEARVVSIVVLALVGIGLVVLFIMARNHDKVDGIVDRIGQRSSLVRRWIAPQIHALLQGLSALTSVRQLVLSFGMILLSWVFAVTQYYIMILPFAPNAPVWWGMFVDAALALGIAVPSAPGSLGVFEAAIAGALAVLGVSRSNALAYAITVHVLQIIITGIFGVYGLIRQGQSFSSLLSSLQLGREPESSSH